MKQLRTILADVNFKRHFTEAQVTIGKNSSTTRKTAHAKQHLCGVRFLIFT